MYEGFRIRNKEGLWFCGQDYNGGLIWQDIKEHAMIAAVKGVAVSLSLLLCRKHGLEGLEVVDG